ncbi:transcription factor Adf-1-like [Teleopsis dalmanni]|uniref:transcription factor Adf-1-like n=2 Tax=Teleopsis dalmanni TaxID=139649 RepID=UPI0018CF6F21|nr:transcription factor Adf-1-like [Teleopsis dalmanni]
MQSLNKGKIEKLIELVKSNPILFDKKHPGYKYQYKKEKIWDAISADLNTPKAKVQRAWKSLRDAFARYCNEVRTSTGMAAKCKKPYRYYDTLLFLYETMEHRRSNGKNQLVKPELDSDELLSQSSLVKSLSTPAAKSVLTVPIDSPQPATFSMPSSPLPSSEDFSEVVQQNSSKKKRRLKSNNFENAIMLLNNLVGQSDGDSISKFFDTAAEMVRTCTLSTSELFDFQVQSLSAMKEILQKMGKL